MSVCEVHCYNHLVCTARLHLHSFFAGINSYFVPSILGSHPAVCHLLYEMSEGVVYIISSRYMQLKSLKQLGKSALTGIIFLCKLVGIILQLNFRLLI